MITLSRKLVRTVRAVFRQALNVTSRSRAPAIALEAGPTGIAIRGLDHELAAAYHVPGDYVLESLAIPFQALVACEGRRDEPVTFRRDKKQVIVEWTEAGIPQSQRFDCPEFQSFPELPQQLQAHDGELWTALREAAATTDRESSRYALACLQLRGSEGRIAAIDGRQLYAHAGFQFPWDEDLLMPASKVFHSAEFQGIKNIEIGKTDDWVVLRALPWVFYFKINQEGRFPQVDALIAPQATATATLELAPSDAAFLTNALECLPGNEDVHQPVTVDLNGEVAIRAKGEDQPLTELVLTQSKRGGEPMRFVTNRTYLARAAALGFTELRLTSDKEPILCCDGRRSYVWMTLETDSALKPNENAVRIESPATSTHPTPNVRIHQSPQPVATERTTTIPMPQKQQPHANGQPVQPQVASQSSAPSLLAQAEAVRDSLQSSLQQVRDLITTLRKRKKQSQLVESTLASLKQLESIGA